MPQESLESLLDRDLSAGGDERSNGYDRGRNLQRGKTKSLSLFLFPSYLSLFYKALDIALFNSIF